MMRLALFVRLGACTAFCADELKDSIRNLIAVTERAAVIAQKECDNGDQKGVTKH